jgi:hypothetical protein
VRQRIRRCPPRAISRVFSLRSSPSPAPGGSVVTVACFLVRPFRPGCVLKGGGEGMGVGKIIFGSLGFLAGAALIAGSLSILTDERDADDFFVSHEQDLARASFGITSENVDVLADAPGWLADWLTDPVDVRVRGASSDGGDISFGIADTEYVEEYLAGVRYDEVTSIDFKGNDISYRAHDGAGIPAAPGREGFWVASIEGPGEQTLDWSLQRGDWSLRGPPG